MYESVQGKGVRHLVKRTISYFFTPFVFALVMLAPLDSSGASFLETFRDSTPILPREELRAAWVVRHTLNTRDDIDRAVEYAIHARFHMIFAQVRGRGDVYYRSDLEPVARSLEVPIDQFDPLDYLLGRAHEAGIEVHAWVNVFYVWSDPRTHPPPNHIVTRHPEWLVADETGVRMDERPVGAWQDRNLEGYYVSPGNPAVREHTAAVIGDLVERYPVDGVHLDYIRYPNAHFDFGEVERTRFMLRYGVDPKAVRERSKTLGGIVAETEYGLLDSLVVEWRVSQVDSMVLKVRSVIGDLPLSAAVIPDFNRARVEKGQDWRRWVTKRLVDFVVPMAYAYEPAGLVRQMRMIKRSIGAEHFLVGLPVYDGRSRNLGYSVSLLRQEGILGYSLFSYNALAEERFSLRFLERVFLKPPE